MATCNSQALLLFALLVLAAAPGATMADTTYTGAYTLEDVVVSTDREGKTVEAVATVAEVTAPEIETRGARTLDEAIALLPGVNVRTGGQGTPRIDMRGFKTRHVLILLDGIPMNSTFDAQFDPTTIPAEMIEKIKVAYANSSVLYGQGALGGVINIITKRGRPGIHGSASEEFGENINHNGRYTLSAGRKNLDLFMSGSRFSTEGFELARDFKPTSEENGNRRENSDSRRNNFFAKVGYTPGERWLLGLSFNTRDGQYGIPGSIINDSADLYANKTKYERVDDYHGYSLQASANYDAPGPWEFKSWAFINRQDEETNQYDDRNYNSMDDLYKKGTYHQNNLINIIGANLQAKCDLGGGGILTLGSGGEKDSWEGDGKIRDKLVAVGGVNPFDTSGGGGGGGGGGGQTQTCFMRRFDTDHDVKIYSTAAEYEVSPITDLGIVLGYSHYWLLKDSGGKDHKGSYLAGLEYALFESTKLHGSFSHKIRFPSISQLYDEVKGNPGLKTESSNCYELGISRDLPGQSKVDLTGFYIKAKDFIQKDEDTQINANRDKTRFRGFEMSAGTRVLPRTMLRLGYTFMDSEDRSKDTDYDEIQYTPRDKLTLEGTYSFPFGLSVYASLLHINRQYYYTKKAPILKRKLNEYTLVDCKISQKLNKDILDIYAGANNLFDKNYETSYGLPQSGQYLYAGIKVGF